MGARPRLLTVVVAGLIVTVALATGSRSALGAAHHHRILPPIIVHDNDDGATINARVGQQIDILLQDPWHAPGGWRSPEISGDAVEFLGRSPAPTAIGTDCFRLRAVKKGRATVSLLCFPPPPQPGHPSPLVIRLFEVTFDVEP
jgi:hypothetical protein